VRGFLCRCLTNTVHLPGNAVAEIPRLMPPMSREAGSFLGKSGEAVAHTGEGSRAKIELCEINISDAGST
jgi:hypothetical protein